jgi:hypothetical protein
LGEILHFVQNDNPTHVILSPSLAVMLSEAKHLSFPLRAPQRISVLDYVARKLKMTHYLKMWTRRALDGVAHCGVVEF